VTSKTQPFSNLLRFPIPPVQIGLAFRSKYFRPTIGAVSNLIAELIELDSPALTEIAADHPTL